jgi:hypothetical protein
LLRVDDEWDVQRLTVADRPDGGGGTDVVDPFGVLPDQVEQYVKSATYKASGLTA